MKFLENSFKSEFKLINFSFLHYAPEDFVKSQWQHGHTSVIYLLWRWFIALFYMGVFIYGWVMLFHPDTWVLWFKYITNWGIFFCVITQLWGAAVVTWWHFHPQFSDRVIKSHSVPLSFQIFWLLHTVTLVIAIVITFTFWLFLFEANRVGLMDSLMHMSNSIGMFLDLFIVAYPVRILHWIYPVMFGLIYYGYTLVFYGVAHTWVYPFMDWTKPGETIGLALGFFGCGILIHCVCYLIYNLRMAVFRKYFQDLYLLKKAPRVSIPKNGGKPLDIDGSSAGNAIA